MSNVRQLFPRAIYDTKKCMIVHLGLYVDDEDIWRVYLGWPTPSEITAAKERGLRAIPVTVQYDPPR